MTPKQIRILFVGTMISSAFLAITLITGRTFALNGCMITWAAQLCLLVSDLQETRTRARTSSVRSTNVKSA